LIGAAQRLPFRQVMITRRYINTSSIHFPLKRDKNPPPFSLMMIGPLTLMMMTAEQHRQQNCGKWPPFHLHIEALFINEQKSGPSRGSLRHK
jgi:hypothetical protein